MVAVYMEAVLDVTPEQAWRFVDRYSRAEVHIFSSVTNERMDGDEYRVMESTDDRPRETTHIRERIISTDARIMRHSYTVEQLFGAEHHSASMQIFDDGGKARFVWITDVLPHSFFDSLEGYWDELFEELKAAVLASVTSSPA